jgi:hypothetical protein
MELFLERKIHNENSTEGNLYVDEKWFANTIEDRVRAKPGEWKKEIKVYGKTAIPYGRYPVLVTWSNRFQRMMVGIFNVPDFEGIRIHWGTSELSSAGCVIISYHDDDAAHRLILEKQATEDLIKKVEDAQKTGKIFITIADVLPSGFGKNLIGGSGL